VELLERRFLNVRRPHFHRREAIILERVKNRHLQTSFYVRSSACNRVAVFQRVVAAREDDFDRLAGQFLKRILADLDGVVPFIVSALRDARVALDVFRVRAPKHVDQGLDHVVDGERLPAGGGHTLRIAGQFASWRVGMGASSIGSPQVPLRFNA
jgi:hypothetical protein